MRGLIYTAITGGYDSPRAMTVLDDDVAHWMFVNGDASKGWQREELPVTNGNPQRVAREIKVKGPCLWPQFDWYLWLDGTMQLRQSMLLLIDKWMAAGVNFAAFRHNEWDCAYREIEACRRRQKDRAESLRKAEDLLRKSNHPANYGQIATGVLWRRGCKEVRSHANSWWEAMRVTTLRDQCTFMWALRYCKQEVEFMPGLHTKNKLVHYRRGHRK